MPRPIVVIPARMAAQRLPGKPLADIGGLPMIVRVLRQAGLEQPLATGLDLLFEDQPGLQMGTLVAPEASVADRTNPDVVKAILALARDARQGRALYFTRSTLYGEGPIWRHIGLYGYTPQALDVMTTGLPTALERREKLEQLRALELGLEIWAAIVDAAPISVDNHADLEAARVAVG